MSEIQTETLPNVYISSKIHIIEIEIFRWNQGVNAMTKEQLEELIKNFDTLEKASMAFLFVGFQSEGHQKIWISRDEISFIIDNLKNSLKNI